MLCCFLGDDMFRSIVEKGFQVEFHGHAEAILSGDFPEASGNSKLS